MSTNESSRTMKPTLILGGTGKTGRRVADRLTARGLPVRIGSRSGQPPFDWNDQTTWAAVLQGVGAVYITYFPDLAVPGAAATVGAFAELAVKSGVPRLILLSGRGEEEAQHTEELVRKSGADWTILRASWFAQNFSENLLLESVLNGVVALPVGDVREPFVDAEDIADVAIAALTEDGHVGQLYELTGPRLLTFAEAIAEISRASGREIKHVQISPDEFASALKAENLPEDVVWLLMELFTRVLDGRNSSLANGVARALGRKPRDFSDYVRDTAATGIWAGCPV